MPSDNSPSLVHPPIGTLIDDDSLELVEVLGVGGYGVVYRAEDTCSSSPKSYAVKCLVHRHNPQSLRQRQIHIREIALHQLAGAHPNVVTLHRVIEDYNYTFIIMDYATDHDLFSQILHNCRYLGEDYLIKHVFLQLLDAVEYCHSLGIYHRDLKPENILCFDGGLRIAITDFGLATTDKVSEEFRTGSVYHMSPECQGGQFAPCGSYSPMANDIWSLGIILLNLATGRNPWKSASATDPTFQAYLRDPLNFLPTVLPISQEVNIILTRMLELDWRDRMGIPEIRQAIEDLDTFYSDGVIFEGSMARCPWEAGMEIDSDSSATKYEPVKSMAADLKSHWSQESEIVFAHHSPTTEGGWVDYPEYTGPVNAAYAVNPEDRASMYDDCGDLFTRARTPPSIESPCASETGSSYPVTPSSFDVSFGGRAVLPSRKQRKPLMIDTSCTPRHPRYYNGSDSLGTLSSDSSSIMETAVEEPTGHYDSTYFVRDLSQKPSPITMPQSVTLGDSGDTEDKEMASPTVWNCATADAPEIPSMYSSTRTSFTNTHLSFDHRSNAPSPDTMTWSDVEYHPDRQVPESQPSFSFYMSNAPSRTFSPSAPCSPAKKSFETKLKATFFTPLRFFPRPSSWQASSPSRSSLFFSNSPTTSKATRPSEEEHHQQQQQQQQQQPFATFSFRQTTVIDPASQTPTSSLARAGFEILATACTAHANPGTSAFLASPTFKSSAAVAAVAAAAVTGTNTAARATTATAREHSGNFGRRVVRHRHWFLPTKLFSSAEAS
ncbi:kinase-like protein [Dendrothele bispora CBS 962.96]|uniref:Kinase-like protein n=1 Tax=Dendrothele bispora (strain CBS 962.96) TaxID=1314807 RepID=A0A4S8L775_DENBC|nr:kinase-like protein [Dendrothele bispora CBS 962.96]